MVEQVNGVLVARLLRSSMIASSLLAPACMPTPREAGSRSALSPTHRGMPVDELVEGYLEAGHIPGLGVAVVAGGEVIEARGYGITSVLTGQPVGPQTPFMLASVSKLVTGMALLQVAEQGRGRLDEPIAPRLDFQLDNPQVEGERITAWHLATHSSGLKDHDPALASGYSIGDSQESLRDFLASYFDPEGSLYDPEANFRPRMPGTRRDYSNVGAALAGHLVEVLGGMRLDDHCDLFVFEPLGMVDAGWHLADHDPNLVASPHIRDGEGFMPLPHYGYPDWPDGQLRASALDLGRLLAAVSRGGELEGERVLEPETVEEMLRLQLDFDEEQGLFWQRRSRHGRELWGHGGSDAGVATEVMLDLEADVGVVLLANTGWTDASREALRELQGLLLDEAERWLDEQSGMLPDRL